MISRNSTHLRRFRHAGQIDEALKTAELMDMDGIPLSRDDAYDILQGCEKIKDLQCFRKLQIRLTHSGLDSIAALGDHLIRLFSHHERLLESNWVFTKITKPGAHSWTAIISANANLGQGKNANELHHRMQWSGVRNDNHVYIAAIKGCAATCGLLHGRLIHSQIIESGIRSDVVRTTLIDMYAKCGSLEEACKVFDNLSSPDVVSWGAIIAGCAQHGEGLLALQYYEKMQEEDVSPTRAMFLGLLKACMSMRAISRCRVVHVQVIEDGLKSDIVMGSTLIDAYAKCGSLEEAFKVFDKIPALDVVTWGVLIEGLVHNGEGQIALAYYEKMQESGLKPDRITFLSALKLYATLRAIQEGRILHCHIIDCGLGSNVVVQNTIVDMYIKCGNLEEACKLFDKLPNQDVVSFGIMIGGYADHSECSLALRVFEKMQEKDIKPSNVVFSGVLKACAGLKALEEGRLIHDQVMDSGLQLDPVVGCSLVDMYVKCGRMEDACRVFDTLPNTYVGSWNAVITGYLQHRGDVALKYFDKMRENGINPDAGSLSTALKACASIGSIVKGRHVHEQIAESGLQLDATLRSSLIDMYAKCGSLDEACRIFNELHSETLVLWGAITAGYAQHGEVVLVSKCFEMMQQKGLCPDEIIFTNILIACSHGGLVDEGRHYFISMQEAHEITPGIPHFTSMADLLGRSGCLNEANILLRDSLQPNIVGWTSLLNACRMHGNIETGRHCFDQVVSLDFCCAAGYILMSNIFADAGMQEDQKCKFTEHKLSSMQ